MAISINSTPVLLAGDYVTTFETGVDTTLTDFVFPSIQETIFVFNEGINRLTVIASGKTYYVKPNEAIRIVDDVTTIQVKADFGTQPFNITGRTSGDNGIVDGKARTLINANALTLAEIANKYNFINDANLIPDTFLANDGTTSVNTTYATTDFIPVKAGSVYTTNTHRRTVFYDTNKLPTGAYFDSGFPIYSATDIIVPSGVTAYMRTTIPNANLSGYYLNAKSYNAYKLGNAVNTSFWNSKKMVTLGDSISAQDGVAYSQGDVGAIAIGYQSILKDKLSLLSCNNQAVSGRPMADGSASGVGTVTTGLAITSYAPYDLTIIAAGTNDFKLNIPMGVLGVIGDTSFDRNTFYGAYRTLIEYILNSNPKIRIVLFTPLQRDNSGYDVNFANTAGNKLIDYVNGIKSIGQMYSLPVCDMYANSGITKLNMSTYLMDGLHPNDMGYGRMGRYATKFIEGIAL